MDQRPISPYKKASSPGNFRKSVRRIKEMSQKEFYNQRVSKIKSYLEISKIDLNGFIPERELLKFLDNLSSEPFDREIAKQLFDKMPCQPSPHNPLDKIFNVHDFVEAYIKAEFLLLVLAEEIETDLDRVYEQIQTLTTIIQDERMKSSQRGDQNSLTVDILSVIDSKGEYDFQQGDSFSVLVVCNNYKYETDELQCKTQEFNLQFDHNFHIRVTPNVESFMILLRNNDRFNAGDPNYKDIKCTIPVKRFQDFQEHIIEQELFDSNHEITSTVVKATVLWSAPTSSLHTEKVALLQEVEKKLLENRENIEYSLKALVYPFTHSKYKI